MHLKQLCCNVRLPALDKENSFLPSCLSVINRVPFELFQPERFEKIADPATWYLLTAHVHEQRHLHDFFQNHFISPFYQMLMLLWHITKIATHCCAQELGYIPLPLLNNLSLVQQHVPDQIASDLRNISTMIESTFSSQKLNKNNFTVGMQLGRDTSYLDYIDILEGSATLSQLTFLRCITNLENTINTWGEIKRIASLNKQPQYTLALEFFESLYGTNKLFEVEYLVLLRSVFRHANKAKHINNIFAYPNSTKLPIDTPGNRFYRTLKYIHANDMVNEILQDSDDAFTKIDNDIFPETDTNNQTYVSLLEAVKTRVIFHLESIGANIESSIVGRIYDIHRHALSMDFYKTDLNIDYPQLTDHQNDIGCLFDVDYISDKNIYSLRFFNETLQDKELVKIFITDQLVKQFLYHTEIKCPFLGINIGCDKAINYECEDTIENCLNSSGQICMAALEYQAILEGESILYGL